MPKFLVTNGSNFQPFTYDELTRPLYEMAEAKRNTQDQYDALSMQTEALRNYISENEDDKRAKAMYDNYVSKLNALQENLWSHGYTASTRRDLNAARSAFSSDIARLGKAIENRQTRSAEYNKFKHDHPDMVMGSDPGLDGLDNYLDNDLYGTDWYQYSGNQFMSEVGADAKARANEMLNNPEIMRDPRLAGYITKITREGFSNDEVDAAGAAVKAHLAGDSSYLGNLDPASSILANVLLTHLESTGAAGNVSDAEFNRLVDYGINGLSQAVGKTHTQELSDKVWDANKQYSMWYRQESQRRAWAKQDAEEAARAQQAAALDRFRDNFEFEVDSEAARKFAKEYGDYNTEGNGRLYFTKSGKEIRNAVGASSEVYGEDIRQRYFNDLHFDIGRDPKRFGEATTDKYFLKGYVVDNAGNKHNIQYNPHKSHNGVNGVIEIIDEGKPKYSEFWTNRYHKGRDEYENRVQYYKKNEKDIYDLATIDPDKQYKDYTAQGLGFDTPLEEFYRRSLNMPTNAFGPERGTYIAREGDSDNLVEVFAKYLSQSIPVNEKGEPVKDRNWRTHNGSTFGIHEINKNGAVRSEAVKRPGDVIKIGADGKSNITSIGISPGAIMSTNSATGLNEPGYLIFRTRGGQSYAVGIDMFDSDMMRGILSEAKYNISRAMNESRNAEQRDANVQLATQMAAFQLYQLLGQELVLKVKGQTGDAK